MIMLSKSASVDTHLWTFLSSDDRMTMHGVVINTAVCCRKGGNDKSADHLNLNSFYGCTTPLENRMECSVVKKGPDRVPGGNGCAALAVGILDQDHSS